MLYILLSLLSIASFASEIQYRVPGYYNKVNQINDNTLHTGDYVSQNSQISLTTTTIKEGNTVNIEQPQQVMKGGSTTIRENSHYSPYRSYTKVTKKEPQFSILGHLGIGGQYLYSRGLNYTTVTGSQTNILGHAHTYTILPIGLELAVNINQKNTIFFGGSYYINPFRSLVENTYNNQKVFEGRTNYMIYGKYAYRFQQSVSVYILGGVTQFRINVYNDISNVSLMQANTFSPSFGAGLLLHLNDNTTIFLDGIYSFIGSLDSTKMTDRRLTAISQRSYGGMQARVGISYNFTRAFF